MVYRNSWLAGFAALAFAFIKLNGLLLKTAEGFPWQMIVLGGLALGILITWAALAYRLKTWLVVVVNAAVALIAIVRVAVPETTWFLFPTRESFVALGAQLSEALEQIRTGIEPVVPRAGIVVVVMLVLWAVGVLFAWGLQRGHPYVALLPPLVLSLQFSTMDRNPTSVLTIAVFIALVALIILAVTADERDRTMGRMAPRGEWPRSYRPTAAAATLLGITVLGSVVAVNALDESVPGSGYLDWRVDSGLPSDTYGSSGFSVNPFIGIQQRLVSTSTEPAFFASVGSELPPDQVYFRLMTMEYFDGTNFAIRDADLVFAESGNWEHRGHRFEGPTEPLASIVAIANLKMEWLPTPAGAFAVEGVSERIDPYLRGKREDGALLYDGFFTTPDLQYRVDAAVPRPDVDVLATNHATGELSIVFREALRDEDLADDTDLAPAPVQNLRPEPPDAEFFLELPDDPGVRISDIRTLALAQTQFLETEYEKALAIEAWLRTFDYETAIDPANAADELWAWLLDEDSPNYRTGYCENFATAMAVMARTLGIHSRVVLGFTPGEQTAQEGIVVVRDRNAHAWVEIWIPAQGWVRFDPTPRPDRVNPSTIEQVEEQLALDVSDFLDIDVDIPNLPPVQRPQELLPEGDLPEIIVATPQAPGGGGGGFSLPSWLTALAPLLGITVVLVAGMPLLKLWLRRRRMRRLRNGDISAAWEDIVLRLHDLGTPVDDTRTPAEVAFGVDAAMAPLASVYGKSVYGPGGSRGDGFDVTMAENSLQKTREHLVSITSARRRLAAWYRPGSVIRLRRGRNGQRED